MARFCITVMPLIIYKHSPKLTGKEKSGGQLLLCFFYTYYIEFTPAFLVNMGFNKKLYAV